MEQFQTRKLIQRKQRKTRKVENLKNIKVYTPNKISESMIHSSNTLDYGSPLFHIREFKHHGIKVLEALSEEDIATIIKVSNDSYYNTNSQLLSDNEYDIIKDYMERKYPKNEIVKEIGAPVTDRKVKLPYEMPSMDKIKPDTNALAGWTHKYTGPYNLSCKLDGVSGLYIVENGNAKLYTRGDGKVGQDISFLLPVLKLPMHEGFAVRGEFILPKKVFDEKYKTQFANPRNLVSGIVNRKTIDEKTADLQFVAYEIITPSSRANMKPSDQLAKLIELKHNVVQHKLVSTLANNMLSELLLDWRSNYQYEIDGIIVTDDNIYPRKSGNPEHAFAFKMVISDQLAECKVVDVIWTPSKNGYLKPRVRIEPVALCGVTIEYATGFNGKFIQDNKIGIGAVIQIVRSGDVIPYIKDVTTPAEEPKMPDVAYVWTDTMVDIILENYSDDITVREKNVTGFFVTLGVDGLSSGNIKRLFAAGYDSVSKILKMQKPDYEKVDGFKTKMIEKIYNGIREKVESASLIDIMVASNRMGKGLGMRKITPIMEAFPDILTSTDPPETKIEIIKTIKGIGNENANEFVYNIPGFLAFIEECGLQSKLSNPITKQNSNPQSEISNSHPLYKKKIVMTKIRDKEIIQKLAEYGASLEDNMKSDIFALIVKSLEDTSTKTEYAKKNGIPIMTAEEFKQRYF